LSAFFGEGVVGDGFVGTAGGGFGCAGEDAVEEAEGEEEPAAVFGTMREAEKTRRRLRPMVSARAPEGTSNRKMEAAQAALSMTYWSRVRPRSVKRTARTG
jgi:hypothetical protein